MSSAIEQLRGSEFVEGDVPRLRMAVPARTRCFCAQGVSWSVYENDRCYVGRSLIFESDRIVRRVRVFPRDWEQLTDEELVALSWSR